MKEYYATRWYWIFHYTSKKFWYCLAKTLCIIVGLPIYSVCFLFEMLFTAINMLFCWIPILKTVVLVICKSLTIAFGSTFYICILTDLKSYKQAVAQTIQYDVADADTEQADAEGSTASVQGETSDD